MISFRSRKINGSNRPFSISVSEHFEQFKVPAQTRDGLPFSSTQVIKKWGKLKTAFLRFRLKKPHGRDFQDPLKSVPFAYEVFSLALTVR